MPSDPARGRLLRAVLAARRRDTTAAALLVSGHQLAEAAVPVTVGLVIDRAVATGDGGALVGGLAVVAAVFVILAASAYAGYWLIVRAERAAGHDVRVRVTRRALDPAGGLPGRPGLLVGLAGTDADRTGEVCRAVVQATSALAALIGGAVVLFLASWLLAAVVLGGIVAVLVASRLLARPLVGRAEAEQAALVGATAVATDVVTGLRVIKGIGAEDAAAQSYRRASRAALVARLAASRVEGGYDAATGVVSALVLVLAAWVGARLALDGTISVGELVAGVGLAQFLVGPLQNLTAVGPVLAGAAASAGRVAAVLDTPLAVGEGPTRLPTARVVGAVRVGAGAPPVAVAAGEQVGVVPLRQVDAAALVDALGRDADIAVTVDGVDLRTVSLDEARAAVLVIRRGEALFAGPAADTVGLDPAVHAAVAADEVLAGLPAGVHTTLAEGGRTLSGGQRQRLGLARALAADPPVLVLHDPTTAVDAVTEQRIADGVTAWRAGRTTVLITTSPAWLSRCRRVLLIDDGAIVADGSHSELVGDPRYRDAVLA